MTATDIDLTAADVCWNLEPLLDGASSADELVTRAKELAESLQPYRGRVGTLEAGELAELMTVVADISELLGRAGHYGMLRFSQDTQDPERWAEMQQLQEQSTEVGSLLLFVELEFASAADDHVAAIIGDERLHFCRHHLETTRLNRPHLLSEAEETVLIETSMTRASAWVRLFSELTSVIEVELDDGDLAVEPPDDDVLAVDEALKRLEASDERKGRIVELRYFGGLTNEETAQVLDLSVGTIEREWRFIKAWLQTELKKDADA